MNEDQPTDDRRQATYRARDQFARSLGEVSPDVLAPLINPGLLGGPLWPDTRQAFQVIRRQQHLLIMGYIALQREVQQQHDRRAVA